MDESERAVLDWAARFIEKSGELDCGTLLLVVSGERGWRFSTKPVRSVCEEPSASLNSSSADCTVFVSAADLVQLSRGELNPQAAFATGRIRVAGDGLTALRMNLFVGP